jgi:predicted nucleic acid-binding protein
MQETLGLENLQEKMQTTEKYFLDTNALAYLISNEDLNKHKKIKEFVKEKHCEISSQNLRELTNVLFKKTKLDNKEIRNYLIKLGKKFTVNYELIEDTLNSINFLKSRKNFYDALLVATMLRNGIRTIVTENEKDFLEFKGIKVINPFKN